MTTKTIVDRLQEIVKDLRCLASVLNEDESFKEARIAQDALEKVAQLRRDLPVPDTAWPPQLDKDGAFVMPGKLT